MSPLDNIRPNRMPQDDKGAGTPETQQPEKLTLEESSGLLRYGRIPYEIRYDLNAPTSEILDEKNPGNYLLEPDEQPGPDSRVTMWVHESCPPQYKHIVMYHELIEAEYELGDNIPRIQAHHLAVTATDAYAKAHLSPKEFEEYKDWERSVLPDIVARRSKDSSSE